MRKAINMKTKILGVLSLLCSSAYAYFPGSPAAIIQQGGTGATTASQAISNLGGVHIGGDTMSGALYTPGVNDSSLSPSQAVVSDSNSNLVSSSTTSTELSYMHGVTEGVQTQLNAKQTQLSTGNLTGQGSVMISGGTGSVIGTGSQISVATSGSLTTGVLASSDWNSFNTGASEASTAIQSVSGQGSVSISSAIGGNVTVSVSTSGTSSTGVLASSDWNNFNNKISGSTAPLTSGAGSLLTFNGTAEIIGTAVNITVATAGTTQTGMLLASDWNTFNGKQSALGYTPVNKAGDSMTGPLNVGAVVAGTSLTASTGGANIANGQPYSIAGSPFVSVGTGVGAQNVLLGVLAGSSITSGGQNTFIGNDAGLSVSTGIENVFVGSKAGEDSTLGNMNIGIGVTALGQANFVGNGNVAVGHRAGEFSTTASNNTFIGYEAGTNISTSQNVVAIGASSGLGIGTSSNLTLVGANANVSGDTFTNSVALGQNAVISASSTVQIGNGTNSTPNTMQFEGYNFLTGLGAATFASVNLIVSAHVSSTCTSVHSGVGVSSITGSSSSTGCTINFVATAPNEWECTVTPDGTSAITPEITSQSNSALTYTTSLVSGAVVICTPI
jgi:hypothetical protein